MIGHRVVLGKWWATPFLDIPYNTTVWFGFNDCSTALTTLTTFIPLMPCFNANRISLKDYHQADLAYEINVAADQLAREAADEIETLV
ncbi:MAG: hypothetical protein B6247_25885 [Candidatus Parabeggiatoa sp. nov. 2]|nr:MAG: hypothetical protein B6247_25885 [Beggiatoa sp. 4572_84]